MANTTSFFSLLGGVRPEIESALESALSGMTGEHGERFPLDAWLVAEAGRRVSRGKLMRGGLVIGAYEAFGGTDRRTAVQAAAAVELYGTGLLMQDDVTDRSGSRRGLPTIHVIASAKAQELALHDPAHFGENCGTYLGDILFFTAQSVLAHLPLTAQQVQSISGLCARELWMLGFAQLEDIRLSKLPPSDRTVTQDHILSMLAGKTGRYSVAWPLSVGALLAGAPTAVIDRLTNIGTQIGVLYQLRDDELGLFGDPAATGKSNEDDLREGKKTLYWLHLITNLPQDDPRWQAFGNGQSTAQELDALRQFIRESGGEKSVRESMLEQQRSLGQLVSASDFPNEVKALLHELLVFVVERKK